MRRYSNDLRIRVVESYFRDGQNCRTVALFFSVGKSTVARWVKEYQSGQLLEKYCRPPSRNKQLLAQKIEKYVNRYPLTDLKQIQTYLRRQKIRVSLSTISRSLKSVNITYKQVKRNVLSKKSTPKKREKFRNKIRQMENVYCLDETGFYLTNLPRKGWSKKGTKCLYGQRSPLFRKVSMIMIISNQKIVKYKILDKSLNRHSMLEFLREIPGLKGRLLMDNLRVHHCQEIRQYLDEKDLSPIYTLPYSPELNPIEEVFSVIKRQVRKRKVFGQDQLTRTMTSIVQDLNKRLDFGKFYHHAFHDERHEK